MKECGLIQQSIWQCRRHSFPYREHHTSWHCIFNMDKLMNHVHAHAVLLALLLMFAAHAHCK
jgi:hypothetical protein